MATKQVLKGLSPEELKSFFQSIGEPAFRAKQLYSGLYKNRYSSFSEFTSFSLGLRQKLEETAELPSFQVHKDLQSKLDGTRKFSFIVGEQREIEAVWIPSEDGNRKTICISSQVGCTLACEFCATGKLPFKGNLKAWQILEQVLMVEKLSGEKASNIVFMGMGEPMHNYHSVMKAASILSDPDAFGLGTRRITISTSGDIKGIERFIRKKEPYNFAISLNHPDPEKRGDIMGIDKKYPLEDLIEAARNFTRTLNRRITFEYILIPGVNMGQENAKKLKRLVSSLNCKLNLIPLNTEFNGWRRPTESEIEEFREQIKASGVPVMNRRSPGKDINGACGMLALKG